MKKNFNIDIWLDRKKKLRAITANKSLPVEYRAKALKLNFRCTDLIMYYFYGTILERSFLQSKKHPPN